MHGEPLVATQCRDTADASQDLRFQCDADVDGRSDGTQQDEDTIHASVYVPGIRPTAPEWTRDDIESFHWSQLIFILFFSLIFLRSISYNYINRTA